MSTVEIIGQLLDALNKQSAPAIPISIALWDVSTAAAYLNKNNDVFRDRIAALPDFPRAIRLPAKVGRAHPMYRATEVIAWAATYQDKR